VLCLRETVSPGPRAPRAWSAQSISIVAVADLPARCRLAVPAAEPGGLQQRGLGRQGVCGRGVLACGVPSGCPRAGDQWGLRPGAGGRGARSGARSSRQRRPGRRLRRLGGAGLRRRGRGRGQGLLRCTRRRRTGRETGMRRGWPGHRPRCRAASRGRCPRGVAVEHPGGCRLPRVAAEVLSIAGDAGSACCGLGAGAGLHASSSPSWSGVVAGGAGGAVWPGAG
jgi:hypothetical protein